MLSYGHSNHPVAHPVASHLALFALAEAQEHSPPSSFPFTTYSLFSQLGTPARHTKPIAHTSCQRFSPMNF